MQLTIDIADDTEKLRAIALAIEAPAKIIDQGDELEVALEDLDRAQREIDELKKKVETLTAKQHTNEDLGTARAEAERLLVKADRDSSIIEGLNEKVAGLQRNLDLLLRFAQQSVVNGGELLDLLRDCEPTEGWADTAMAAIPTISTFTREEQAMIEQLVTLPAQQLAADADEREASKVSSAPAHEEALPPVPLRGQDAEEVVSDETAGKPSSIGSTLPHECKCGKFAISKSRKGVYDFKKRWHTRTSCPHDDGKETTNQAAEDGAGSPGSPEGEKVATTESSAVHEGNGAPAPDKAQEEPGSSSDPYWHGGSLPAGAAAVEILGHYARIVDADDHDLAIIGDVRNPKMHALVEEARRRIGAGETTVSNGAPNPAAAGSSPARPASSFWGRAADKGAAFHVWDSLDDAEARCGEITDGEVIALPAGVKPNADETCVDCADLVGWDVPGKLSRMPATEAAAQSELPLAKEKPGKLCACGKITFKGRQKKVADPDEPRRWHTRAICGGESRDPQALVQPTPVAEVPADAVCHVAGCGEPGKPDRYGLGIWCAHHEERLTTVEKKAIAVARAKLAAPAENAVPKERCLAPDCPFQGEGEGIDCVCELHLVEPSIRAEWLYARHPELKPKRQKPLGTKAKAKEAHGA